MAKRRENFNSENEDYETNKKTVTEIHGLSLAPDRLVGLVVSMSDY